MRSMITIIIESKDGTGTNDYFLESGGDDSVRELILDWMDGAKIVELHSYDEQTAPPTEDGELPKVSSASHHSG